jgi:imidazolonepropionase-like amidohydrolase
MSTDGRHRIAADLLIVGPGETFDDGVVTIDGGRITYAGPAAGAPPANGGTEIAVRTVMPGLWDAHCHFFGIRRVDLAELALDSPIQRAMRVGADATRALMAGITSVREVGGLGVHVARAIEEGTVQGPTVYPAGSILSMTGGHGDVHDLPLSWVADGPNAVDLELCDGVPECLRAVRLQLRRGARVIKVCATGGVLSHDDLRHPQFSHEELTAIVKEAARAERVVAAHCHGKAGIMAAVRAGVRTIEHGTFLDAEAARAMADTGAILVPTRLIGHLVLSEVEESGLPEFARQKLTETYARGREAVGHALDADVTIAAGTDLIQTGPEWNDGGTELRLLTECGLTPSEAIRAATSDAALTVGPQAEGPSTLTVGAPADVIAVTRDPLEDIGVLGRPHEISHVWRAGDLVKAPTAKGEPR